MEQNCDLCNKIFEGTEVWAVSDKKGGWKYKSFCDDCVDARISEVSRSEFDKLLQIDNYQGGDYGHQYC